MKLKFAVCLNNGYVKLLECVRLECNCMSAHVMWYIIYINASWGSKRVCGTRTE